MSSSTTITNLSSPVTITTTKSVNGFLINQVTITPFTSASIVISLYDLSNNYIQNSTLSLTGTNYTNWGNNDQYPITYIEGQIPTLQL